MNNVELWQLLDRLQEGEELPRRVVVNASGLAVNPERALRDYGVRGDLCFVRCDGWTLAAPKHLAGVAFGMWREHWVALIPIPPRNRRLFSEN